MTDKKENDELKIKCRGEACLPPIFFEDLGTGQRSVPTGDAFDASLPTSTTLSVSAHTHLKDRSVSKT